MTLLMMIKIVNKINKIYLFNLILKHEYFLLNNYLFILVFNNFFYNKFFKFILFTNFLIKKNNTK